MKKNIISYLVILLSILLNCSNEDILKKNIISNNNPAKNFKNLFLDLQINPDKVNLISSQDRDRNPTAIVLHTTDSDSIKEYLEKSILNKFFVHAIIDKKGNIYKDFQSKSKVYRLIPKMDKYSVHVAIEGKEDEILSNVIQINKISEFIGAYSKKYSIPLENKDIASEKGVFTHTQAKKKYGNFVDMRDCGGEKLLASVLISLSGKYSPEIEWKDRLSKEWTFRREDPKSNKPKEEFTHGRSITENPTTILENVEKDSNSHIPEDYRVKYVFDQNMEPTCIVLHYTAISDFKVSLKVLEDRRVSANIMVDKDGKAYQLLDSLNHTARAAGGTNNSCIQIEIVGKNTEELLANEPQTKKVIALVNELSKKFGIQISNEKIESLRGVFSHTQAKKKFGRSVALVGKDFDPGEEYMRKVIEATGSKYYNEEDWYDRKSEDWIILYGDFQP